MRWGQAAGEVLHDLERVGGRVVAEVDGQNAQSTSSGLDLSLDAPLGALDGRSSSSVRSCLGSSSRHPPTHGCISTACGVNTASFMYWSTSVDVATSAVATMPFGPVMAMA